MVTLTSPEIPSPSSKTALSPDEAMSIGLLDAHDQAALVARGDLTAGELIEAAISRIEQLNPQLNVITYRNYDTARTKAPRASGPMAGVPWLLKDGLDYPGMPTYAGSRSRRHASMETRSFPYTDAFDAAGLIALGKSNAPEFGLLPVTEPLLHGPTRNPWALERSPGGSSGGSAAAVASGMVPVAHAADGGGSIRIPASCCGLVGLKPGRGANLRARALHVLEDLLACDILLARSVRDVAWAASVGRGTTPGRPTRLTRRLKIAVIPEALSGARPMPEVADVLVRAADLCASLGHQVEEVALPVDGPAMDETFRTVWGYLANDAVSHAHARPAELEPWTSGLAAWAERLGPRDLDEALARITIASNAMEQFLRHYDLILSPVLRRPPLSIGELAPDQPFYDIMTLMFDYVTYTQLHNMTGHPAISLPVFTGTDGIPIGSMFAAARGNEKLLLAIGFELEEAAPWSMRWPAWSVANPIVPRGADEAT